MEALSQLDAYGVARALAGLDWADLQLSPWVRLLLTNLSGQADLKGLLIQILGTPVIAQIFAIDPAGPAPNKHEEPPVVVPPLPPEATCEHDPRAGCWLDEFLAWAKRRSPMTPPQFLESAGIWTIGLAIARRISLNLHSPIYPHLYILWVAPTSIYRKTTGMEAVADLILQAMPHMLLAEESTPEALISALSGKRPPNYDSLSPYERQIDDQGRLYAAQRGILLDEASALFGAAKRDYMQGITEMFLRLYDAPARYTRNVRSEGKLVIRDASLSILGATTPRALAHNANGDSWETGELARYALLYPEQIMAYDLGGATPQEFVPPHDLVARLNALHTRLPKPPDELSLTSDKPAARPAIHCLISKPAHTAYAAYAKAVTWDMLQGDSLDERLVPNYARLHVVAAKISICLAAMDWSDAGGDGSPIVQLDHWARAQRIAESWRASLHHLVYAIAKSEDAITETRVLEHLLRFTDGETLRELTQRLRLERKTIQDALKSLAESGLVEIQSRQKARGPAATVYKAV